MPEHLRALCWVLAATACSGGKATEDTAGGVVATSTCEGWVAPATTAATGDAVCAGSTRIPLDDGRSSGFERCADGTIHRPASTASCVPPATPECSDPGETATCATDAECGGGFGRCVERHGEVSGACHCMSTCESDLDCGAGSFCAPPQVHDFLVPYALCQPASCNVDADCPSGDCALAYLDTCGGAGVQLACRSSNDECRTHDDCRARRAAPSTYTYSYPYYTYSTYTYTYSSDAYTYDSTTLCMFLNGGWMCGRDTDCD